MNLLFRKTLLAGVFALNIDVACSANKEGLSESQESFADLGAITVINPNKPARDLIIILDAAPTAADEIYQLAREGHLIAHVPLQQFLDHAATHRDACISAVTLLDVFSQHLQQKFKFAHYQRPLLIGIDSAAPFALATLAQAPTNLFAAGIGIHFQPEIKLPAPLCPAPALSAQLNIDKKYRIETIDLSAPWKTFSNVDQIESYLNGLAAIKTAAVNAPANDSIADLPLVELPAPVTHTTNVAHDKSLDDMFVILLSGDGGWANIDKDIGDALNRRGLPVVGWNSLQYFWREKKPEQASADLARAIAHYQKIRKRPRVLLIGFSLGADVLPFMISRLPESTRATIGDTVFLALGQKVDFQFHVTDWLGSNNANAHPIAPELAKLVGQPMLCIYGSEDDDTICPEKPKGLDVQMLPGDHHFDGDYERATALILEHMARHGRD